MNKQILTIIGIAAAVGLLYYLFVATSGKETTTTSTSTGSSGASGAIADVFGGIYGPQTTTTEDPIYGPQNQ